MYADSFGAQFYLETYFAAAYEPWLRYREDLSAAGVEDCMGWQRSSRVLAESLVYDWTICVYGEHSIAGRTCASRKQRAL